MNNEERCGKVTEDDEMKRVYKEAAMPYLGY
jgi:hypothetical protein